MTMVLDYPRDGAAQFFDAYTAGEYGQAQSQAGGKLWEVSRRAIRDWTHIPSRPLNRKRIDPLVRVFRAISESRHVLELGDDWDMEGSSAVSEEAWNQAVRFLKNHARAMWQNHGIEIDPPHIAPGPDASIDCHWDFPDYELLINFPADPTAMAECYGDDRGRIRMKATFDPNTINEGLLLWLRKTTTELG